MSEKEGVKMMKEDFPPKHYVHWTVPIMLRKPRFMPYPIYPSLAKYKSDPGEGVILHYFTSSPSSSHTSVNRPKTYTSL